MIANYLMYLKTASQKCRAAPKKTAMEGKHSLGEDHQTMADFRSHAMFDATGG